MHIESTFEQLNGCLGNYGFSSKSSIFDKTLVRFLFGRTRSNRDGLSEISLFTDLDHVYFHLMLNFNDFSCVSSASALKYVYICIVFYVR